MEGRRDLAPLQARQLAQVFWNPASLLAVLSQDPSLRHGASLWIRGEPSGDEDNGLPIYSGGAFPNDGPSGYTVSGHSKSFPAGGAAGN